MKPIEVGAADIERLDSSQLNHLMGKLIMLEIKNKSIPDSAPVLSANITTSDGGEDASIQWTDGPEKTNWLPNRYTMFQAKATEMTAKQCANELMKPRSSELKIRVKEVFERKGHYILFCNNNYVHTSIIDRVKACKNKLKELGVAYADKAQIKIYDANAIASWVNTFQAAVAYVNEACGHYYLNTVMTWESWDRYKEHKHDFSRDEASDSNIVTLKNNLCEKRKVMRMLGLSGLGKSRLAFEAFRPPTDMDDIQQHYLSESLVYISDGCDFYDLVTVIIEWRNRNMECILIVDNCDMHLHELLAREIKHQDSKMSLLTIDYHTDETIRDGIIKVEPCPDETIKNIILKSFKRLQNEDISRVIELAQGFPLMAVLIAESRLDDEPDIGQLPKEAIIDKLLWGRGVEDKEAKNVILSCSMFDSIGYSGGHETERQFVADKIAHISQQDFFSHLNDFIKKGILDKRGRYISVRPKPLALNLAAKQWEAYPPEDWQQLFQDLPESLAESLCSQLKMLDYLPVAQKLVETLCGANGPFSQANVLNSEQGSKLFCLLAENNPKATASALNRAFSNFTTDELLTVGPGRRQLVWAMKKLAFWEDTFPIVAPIFLAFSAAENETWFNNSHHDFIKLFQCMLSGTQASLKQRFEFLKRSINTSDIETKLIIIKCLGAALTAGTFTNGNGVEQQGSRKTESEHRPKTYSDLYAYWDDALNLLTHIATSSDISLRDSAKDEISNKIRELLNAGRIDSLEKSIQTVSKSLNGAWNSALDSLFKCLKYRSKNYTPDVIARVKKLTEMLRPKELQHKLNYYIVGHGMLGVEENEKDKEAIILDKFINELADEFIKNYPNNSNLIDALICGTQIRTLMFGKALVNRSNNISDLIDNVTMKYRLLDENMNPSLLIGIIAAVHRNNCSHAWEIIDTLDKDENLKAILPDALLVIPFSDKQFSFLCEKVLSGVIQVEQLLHVRGGKALDAVSSELTYDLLNRISLMSPVAGITVLEVLAQHFWKDSQKWEHFKEIVGGIVIRPDVIGIMEDDEFFTWDELVHKILNSNNMPLSFSVKKLANNIVESLKSNIIKGLTASEHLQSVFHKLVSKHLDDVWPILEVLLLSPKENGNIINTILSDHYICEGSDTVLTSIPHGFIIDWVEKAPKERASLIAGLMPIKGEEHGWNKTTKYIIDAFGTREVLSAVSANLYCTPLLERSLHVLNYKNKVKLVQIFTTHQNHVVQTWAISEIEEFSRMIEKEMLDNEEYEAGYMRR